MKKLSALLFVTLLMVSSCSDNLSDDKRIWPISAEVIESVEINQNTVTFDLVAAVTSSGWQIAKPDIETSGQDYFITLKGKSPSEPSLPVMSSLSTKVSVKLKPGNTYTFRFWRFDKEPLDTTLTLP